MKFEQEFGGRTLTIEFKQLAQRANGEALVSYGQTTVLVTAVMSAQDQEDQGFFPLTVNYEERYYAAGKIFGSRYIKRESRPSDEAVLTARLIDRAIRPLFPKDFKREVQVIVTCLSWDGENDPGVLGLIGASVVLGTSDIPWQGPLAAVGIGRINSKLVLNPNYEELAKSDVDIVFAGIEKDSKILVNMIEAGLNEVSEDDLIKAYGWAQPLLKKLISFQNQIIKKAGQEKIEVKPPLSDPGLEKDVKEFLGVRLEKILSGAFQDNIKYFEEITSLKNEMAEFIEGRYPGQNKVNYARDFFESEVERILHESALNKKQRADGRKSDEIRTLGCQVGLLPRNHGSGFFTRGLTKSLSILTLGAPGDQQLLEGMEFVGKKRFMHHYNFPPYSVGEIKFLRAPSRRDIGHGCLAEKALVPLIPGFEEFPYTIRVVSEILTSNGSTSMASVSSSALALMDAGVPIKRPAAGIAIGLVKQGSKYQLLTDIQGPEDHHGHMDLKVAGTRKGITALQMDVKTSGIDAQIFKEALERGKKARKQILDEMEKALAKPREKLSPYAPRILTLVIDPEKIRDLIGPGGKVIKDLSERHNVAIDVQQDGTVYVSAESEGSAQQALAEIKGITRTIKVGETFEGPVSRIFDFGAMVEIGPNQEGLIHISKLAPHHVEKVTDVVRLGQIVQVQVISIDEKGRINLIMKHKT